MLHKDHHPCSDAADTRLRLHVKKHGAASVRPFVVPAGEREAVVGDVRGGKAGYCSNLLTRAVILQADAKRRGKLRGRKLDEAKVKLDQAFKAAGLPPPWDRKQTPVIRDLTGLQTRDLEKMFRSMCGYAGDALATIMDLLKGLDPDLKKALLDGAHFARPDPNEPSEEELDDYLRGEEQRGERRHGKAARRGAGRHNPTQAAQAGAGQIEVKTMFEKHPHEIDLKGAYEGLAFAQAIDARANGDPDALDKESMEKAVAEGATHLQLATLGAAVKARQQVFGHSRTPPMGDASKKYDEALRSYVRGANDAARRSAEERLQRGADEAIKEFVADQMRGESADVQEKKVEELLKANKDLLAGSQAKDLLAADGPQGGYAVSPQRSARMMTRIFETSPLRMIANVENATSDVWETLLDDDEGEAEWVGEVDQRGVTETPSIAMVKIPVHEIVAQPRLTQKVRDDAGTDILDWLERKTTRRISRKENLSFVSGTGSLQPKGFLSYDAWSSNDTYQRNALRDFEVGTGSTLSDTGIIALHAELEEEWQQNASWVMSRQVFYTIATLKTADGRSYLLDPEVLKRSTDKVLLGAPVVHLQDMPKTLAANGFALAYGDWSEGYTILDRFGFRVLLDPYTQKPYTLAYTTKRTGAAITNFQAIVRGRMGS